MHVQMLSDIYFFEMYVGGVGNLFCDVQITEELIFLNHVFPETVSHLLMIIIFLCNK